MNNSPKYAWLCSYDICHPKRLRKFHHYIAMYGLALNYSVFFLYVSLEQYQRICQAIIKLIHPSDDVRLYRCAMLSQATVIGEICPAGINLISAQGILFSH